MASLYLLIPIAIIFIVVATSLFFWAVEDAQFDDLEGAAHSILFDEPHNQTSTPPEELQLSATMRVVKHDS